MSRLGVTLVIGSMAALCTSLSDIAAETGTTQSQLTWVIDGYTLAVACLVLPAGAVGDRYGRRAVLIGGWRRFPRHRWCHAVRPSTAGHVRLAGDRRRAAYGQPPNRRGEVIRA
ncbi:hypothetical protein MNVI_00260 [Mycobacterium noviomagense]|uniref:Major facilitator superfamily (MFS) profile domain-containing protein n=1 Tax=Mycobacterium noviomagense TaxID=459858 RepID=A0A7I7P8U0_9MYCO|nr:hypothetical protein MNVI_00260 [Mycobacterium noviomagense]